MLLAGDEIGHTQQGNNNAYCQDNEITWLNWESDARDKSRLLKFVRRVIALFHEQPVFHRRRFFHGQAIQGAEAPEIAWFDPPARKCRTRAWKSRCALPGRATVRRQDRRRRARRSDLRRSTCCCLFNADHANTIPFVLPPPGQGRALGSSVFDTARDDSSGSWLQR